MSHPWVYSVTFTDGKMTLRVEITDLQCTTGAIEITGEATQVNGALAQISCIKNRTDAIEIGGKYYVDVDAVPSPDHPFDLAQGAITVFVRVSKTWVTVLGPGTDGSGGEATVPTWGKYQADGQLDSAPAAGGY